MMKDAGWLLAHVVARLGYTALRVAGGTEALQTASSTDLDLVITDLDMPGIFGWDLIPKLRATTAFGRHPIIVSSVYHPQDYPPDIDGILPKPYTRQSLDQLLTDLLPPT